MKNIQAQEATIEATKTTSDAFIRLNFSEDDYEFANTEIHLDNVQETIEATQNVTANQNVPIELSAATTRRNHNINTKSYTQRKKASVKFVEAFVSSVQQMSKICESRIADLGRKVTYLEALTNDAVRKAKDAYKLTKIKAQLYATISFIDGLTVEDVVKAGSIIALDSGKIDYFSASLMNSGLFISVVFLQEQFKLVTNLTYYGQFKLVMNLTIMNHLNFL